MVVKQPLPRMTKRSACALWRWAVATSPGRMHWIEAQKVGVVPTGSAGLASRSVRRAPPDPMVSSAPSRASRRAISAARQTSGSAVCAGSRVKTGGSSGCCTRKWLRASSSRSPRRAWASSNGVWDSEAAVMQSPSLGARTGAGNWRLHLAAASVLHDAAPQTVSMQRLRRRTITASPTAMREIGPATEIASMVPAWRSGMAMAITSGEFSPREMA